VQKKLHQLTPNLTLPETNLGTNAEDLYFMTDAGV
jgi:hypothetical protein